MTYKVFLIMLAKILAAVAILIFSFTKSNAENPEWIFIKEPASVTGLADDGDYIWVSTSSRKTNRMHKETFKYYDSITTSNCKMIKDKNGNWWFTGFGVYKYDGHSVERHLYDSVNKRYIYTDNIKLTPDNIIWVSLGREGLASYDGKEWIFFNNQNSGLPQDSGLKKTYILALEVDKTGTIWTSVAWTGLTKFDGTKWETFNESNSGLPSNGIFYIITDLNNHLWLATKKGLVKYDGTNWTLFEKTDDGTPLNNISEMAIDSSNNLWLGSDIVDGFAGLINFDGNNWFIYKRNNSKIQGNFVRSIAIDKINNKWIGVIEGNSNLDSIVNGLNIFREGGVILSTVDDNRISEFIIYPNPVSEILRFQIPDNQEYFYKIYDFQGSLVGFGNINESIINISDLVTGFYTIQITDGKNIHYSKFIKY